MAAVTRLGTRRVLLDVSRLIWRAWRGALPTGIDRVCLEYLDHFGPRSQAVVQYRGVTRVLSQADSNRLFGILRKPGSNARGALAAMAPLAWARSRRSPPERAMVYLNPGHTGLHDAALPAWVAAHQLKAVYLIHDLIPVTHPQFCRPGECEKHTARLDHALASATGIIANSGATLDELTAFASARGMDMPPAVTAWLGGPTPEANAAAPAQRLNRPYFVTVGTIEARKNHLLLLRLWRELASELGEATPVLIIIGQRGWEAKSVEAILDAPGDLQPHVRELGRCSDDELAAWLAGARAMLMPSVAEGFGLPVIEAFRYSTPVIATDLPVYREVVGDIPEYLPAHDVKAWKAAILRYTSDDPGRQRQLAALRDYRPPDWEAHFARVERWLGELLMTSPGP